MASAAKRTKLDLLALCRAAPAPDALLDCALRCDVNKAHGKARDTALSVLCANPRVSPPLFEALARAGAA